jgi:hypothetical protein
MTTSVRATAIAKTHYYQLAQRFDQAMESAADSWNKVRQQTEWAATDLRDAVVNGYDYPTIYHQLLTAATETTTSTVEYMTSNSTIYHRFLPTATETATTTVEYIMSNSTIYYHRLLTTATETTTSTVEYMMSDSFSTHTASDVLRSLLSPLLMERSSSPPPSTNIAIDEENSTKNRTTISRYFLAMYYDDNYNQRSASATVVDPCHLSKYDLGFPFGLLADPVILCAGLLPAQRKDTCTTFFTAPLQFLLDMMSNDDCQAALDSQIPKQELNDAFRMYLHSVVVVLPWWRNKIAAHQYQSDRVQRSSLDRCVVENSARHRTSNRGGNTRHPDWC